ncbi:uncharacterized protein [Bos mutus]|uniref:uncharacterized protein isoform X1 n=1 Tax=Bos mutus TaxID=72004 RepID=UPI0038B46FFB
MTWTIDFSECRGVWEVRLYVWPATDSHRLLQCLGHKPIEEPTDGFEDYGPQKLQWHEGDSLLGHSRPGQPAFPRSSAEVCFFSSHIFNWLWPKGSLISSWTSVTMKKTS